MICINEAIKKLWGQMLKFKFLIIIFFLFATYIITENIYNPKQVKTMYFTVWNNRALNGNPTLKTITESAKKNGFQISTTPPAKCFITLTNQTFLTAIKI